jgi:hypothetical protein
LLYGIRRKLLEDLLSALDYRQIITASEWLATLR